jgi:hypothetical protein
LYAFSVLQILFEIKDHRELSLYQMGELILAKLILNKSNLYDIKY